MPIWSVALISIVGAAGVVVAFVRALLPRKRRQWGKSRERTFDEDRNEAEEFLESVDAPESLADFESEDEDEAESFDADEDASPDDGSPFREIIGEPKRSSFRPTRDAPPPRKWTASRPPTARPGPRSWRGARDRPKRPDAPEPGIAEREAAPVEFGVFGPERVPLSATRLIDVWAYLSEDYAWVCDRARALGQTQIVGRKAGVSVELGTLLSVTLEIPALVVHEPFDRLVWNGTPANVSFPVTAPEDADSGEYVGTARITVNGLLIASVRFVVTVGGDEVRDVADRTVERMRAKSAFASYASEDRADVLARIQGMNVASPGLDVFVDVLALRSGDNWREKLREHVLSKDVFYLFWSAPASRSEWVEREWRLALEERELGYITPVPLEDPAVVAPPGELSSLHFNDAYLAYIRYEQWKKERAENVG